jgi:hypothetical protein
MADFITSTTPRSAIRKRTESLADVTAFDNLVPGVITTNPFRRARAKVRECVLYLSQRSSTR